MCIASWIPNTHSEYVILTFHYNSGFWNAPQCYVEGSYSASVLPSHLYIASVVKLIPPLWEIVESCGRQNFSLKLLHATHSVFPFSLWTGSGTEVVLSSGDSRWQKTLDDPTRNGFWNNKLNPLNPELNPICYLLVLLGAHHFLHVSRIRVKLLNFRLLKLYIYGAPILDVSRSHTTTHHSR